MKRRHFLQFAGSALGTIGLSQAGFLQQAGHFNRAMAQSTPRKLALLIGINNYPDPGTPNLTGCLTDIEMQYQLLVHRYGFNPSDILKVADGEAMEPTRDNILQAFEEHLIAQARPGDVVVVHYSGHGAKVQDPQPIEVQICKDDNDDLNGTLVTQDITPEGQTGDQVVVPDIMGRSLFLLTERIPTDNVTMVLDSCFSGAGTRGIARARAVESRLSRSGANLVASPAELENQARWQRELNMSDDEFKRRRALGIAKGVAIGSASCNQVALELAYEGNKVAGIFTYLLTSYLWQLPGAEPAGVLRTNLVRSTRAAVVSRNLSDQVPIFEYAGENQTTKDEKAERPLLFLPPARPFADAVVRTVTPTAADPQIEIWLGGTTYQNLAAVGEGAVYTAIDEEGQPLGNLQLSSREGLRGRGVLLEDESFAVEEGLLLREKVLSLPNPTLRIGIDDSLEGQQTAAAAAFESALSDRVIVAPVSTQMNVELILARTTESILAMLQEAGANDLPFIGSLALFAPDFSRFVPGSAGAVGEAPGAAVSRLDKRLKSLLVAKVLQEMAASVSDLNVTGELFTEGDGPIVPIVSRSARSASQFQSSLTTEPFTAGDNVKIRIRNNEESAVYLSAIAITGTGDIVVLHPTNWNSPGEAARIGPGEELVAPRPEDGDALEVSGNGFLEILTIASQEPLRQLLQALKALAEQRRDTRGFVGFAEGNPLALMNGLLSDVGEVSRSAGIGYGTPEDQTPVDPGAIAVFSTVIEVAEAP